MNKNLTVALIGNPNSGKSTIFNYYTGARQHVGNYPGITVECREGVCTRFPSPVHFLDLPGTYSLTTYSPEEKIALTKLFRSDIDVVICILNASALERNLYLAIQLQELGVPLVIALNMMDEAERNGIHIDSKRLAEQLETPVIPVVAREGKGLNELLSLAVENANIKKKPLTISYGPDIDKLLDHMIETIEQSSFLTSVYAPRFTAIKYIENDQDIIAEGAQENPVTSKKLQVFIQEETAHLGKTFHTTIESLIADYRYGYIHSILQGGSIISCTEENQRHNTTELLDSFFTHRIIGPIVMFFILYLVYEITFALGVYPQDLIESGFGLLAEYTDKHLPDGILKSLLISGIIGGIGGILSFVPLIFLVFLQIAFLEDSGYMSRIAYMTDKIFKFFGLHGYSAMPLIISGGIAGGCAVPGIMATRTLRSPKEKLATILATPYMACGAKLPVFILFVSIFFINYKAEVLFLLTLSGWFFALLSSLLLRRLVIRGDAAPFIMELPPYRWPTLFGVFMHACERIIEYIRKAGTFILAASILLWAMLTFPVLPIEIEKEYTTAIEALQNTDDTNITVEERNEKIQELQVKLSEHRLEYSFIGKLGDILQPITKPIGFTWKENIALLGGLAAKELTISTLGIVYSLGEVDEDDSEGNLAKKISNDPTWSMPTVWSFLFFVLLYAPCLTTLAIMKQETGSYIWVFFSFFSNTALAYLVSFIIYHTL